jgi:hypothetical protein
MSWLLRRLGWRSAPHVTNDVAAQCGDANLHLHS